MLTAETLEAEGSRYAAELVFVPGLWAGPAAWRGFATYLAHRGWGCHLLDLRGLRGGITARAAAVAEFAAALTTPAILLGHDAGALIALAAAAPAQAKALVLVAPLVPGTAGARALTREAGGRLALFLRRSVPPPVGPAAALARGELPASIRVPIEQALGPEGARLVGDVARGGPAPGPAVGVPTLLVSGAEDAVLPAPAARDLARAIGAEEQVIDGAGHWLLAGPAWQRAVGLIHRWIVQRLGEPLLERYREAMAERELDED